ncbi:hypothetical protein ABZU92_18390 [Micromonospora arida]|uniref:hypothetical protein n=1 Tax=Micromonospora arida TaxID=2203715 RepID=UPI0033B28A65
MALQKTTYARYGDDSQMHVYRHEGAPIVCAFCLLTEGRGFRTEDPAEMAGHVDQHRAAGLRTPDGLTERFRALARGCEDHDPIECGCELTAADAPKTT